MVAKRASRWLRRVVPPATAGILGAMALQPIGAMPRAKAVSAVIWQRVAYPPLALPGTDHEFMSVSVSPNMLVKAEGKDSELQTPAGGVSVGEPVSLRFALEWGAMDGPSGFPSLPTPIADKERIHVAMHRGGAVWPSLDSLHWIGISNGGGTTYSLLAMFDWGRNALDEAWIELQAAGRTYWVELPYGFPNVDAKRTQVSVGGGTRPLWSRTGRELFYYMAPDTIMAVSVRLGANITLGNSQQVVKGPYAVAAGTGRHYDVSADGQRFLLLKDAPTPNGQKTAAPEIHLVQHWDEELKRLLPTK